ncbi:MAG: nodulation protein NfeD [Gammaproteobacteria bacterium]|nr:nodulation protein NfeD [Gammaproteobacteria bacterium]
MQALRTSRKIIFRSALLVLAGVLLWSAGPAQDASEEPVEEESPGLALVLTIDDAISVATAEFFITSLETAQERNARILVLELDTPGGLMIAMEDMIKAILASDVPVAVYVTPSGAKAASAGTYILYASHVAAMARTTTLGAATPVSMGQTGSAAAAIGAVLLDEHEVAAEDETPSAESDETAVPAEESETGNDGDGDSAEEGDDSPGKTAEEIDAEAMKRKVVNDAVSRIRSLANLRGRNADWAEQAVREGVTLEAEEAVELNVADFIANDLAEVLEKADGREVDIDGEKILLQTAGIQVERLEPDWRTRFLSILTNPNVAYLLLIVGLYGLLLEGYNPGTWIPGVIGVICLLLAAYALSILPVNYAGLALMALGVGLIVAESVTPSFGVLGTGGVVAFVVGSIILFDTGIPGFEAPLRLIGGVGLAAGLLMLGLVVVLARSRRRPVVSGREGLAGRRATVLEDFEGAGPVLVQGERWHATSPAPVRKGQQLYVQSVDGLRLEVGDSPPAPATRPNLFSLLKKTG